MPEFHELANAFPLLTGEAFDELKADIQKNGQIDPVVMFEGKILDGRNRWRAMQDLGLAHKEIKLGKDVDPVAWVWSKNAVRRQLTVAQKALAATKLVTAKQGDNRHTVEGKTTLKQAADLAGVAERTVQRAKKVTDTGIDDVIKAVESGDLGIVPAEAISSKPKEEQAKIMAQGPKEAAKTVAAEKAGDPKPGRGHVGPEVTMTRQMEASSAEGAKARTKLWAENKELITDLDDKLLDRYVRDLAAERLAIEQLLKLIKLERNGGETPATPRTSGTATTRKAPAKKTAPAPKADVAPKAAPAKKTAARKPVTSLSGETDSK